VFSGTVGVTVDRRWCCLGVNLQVTLAVGIAWLIDDKGVHTACQWSVAIRIHVLQ